MQRAWRDRWLKFEEIFSSYSFYILFLFCLDTVMGLELCGLSECLCKVTCYELPSGEMLPRLQRKSPCPGTTEMQAWEWSKGLHVNALFSLERVAEGAEEKMPALEQGLPRVFANAKSSSSPAPRNSDRSWLLLSNFVKLSAQYTLFSLMQLYPRCPENAKAWAPQLKFTVGCLFPK